MNIKAIEELSKEDGPIYLYMHQGKALEYFHQEILKVHQNQK